MHVVVNLLLKRRCLVAPRVRPCRATPPEKTRGREILFPSLSKSDQAAELDLEFESDAQPHIKRCMVRPGFTKVGIQLTRSAFPELIDDKDTAVVGDIKEVSHQLQFHLLSQADRVVSMKVDLGVERRATQLTATTNGYLARIQIYRMGKELAKRYA